MPSSLDEVTGKCFTYTIRKTMSTGDVVLENSTIYVPREPKYGESYPPGLLGPIYPRS